MFKIRQTLLSDLSTRWVIINRLTGKMERALNGPGIARYRTKVEAEQKVEEHMMRMEREAM